MRRVTSTANSVVVKFCTWTAWTLFSHFCTHKSTLKVLMVWYYPRSYLSCFLEGYYLLDIQLVPIIPSFHNLVLIQLFYLRQNKSHTLPICQNRCSKRRYKFTSIPI